jgi:hypothetical protein
MTGKAIEFDFFISCRFGFDCLSRQLGKSKDCIHVVWMRTPRWLNCSKPFRRANARLMEDFGTPCHKNRFAARRIDLAPVRPASASTLQLRCATCFVRVTTMTWCVNTFPDTRLSSFMLQFKVHW